MMVLLIFIFVFIISFSVSYYMKKTKTTNVKKEEYKVNYKDHPFLDSFDNPSSPKEPEYKTTIFNIAGVTFSDGNKKRQTALRMLKFKDAPMDGAICFEFEQYEYEGKAAVKIIANDRILGNVPAAIVDEFIEDITTHTDYDIDYHVSGGGEYPFGCSMTFTWK